MSGVNKVFLIGNLGKDPQIRHLDNGIAVASFSIATSESYTNKTTNEKVENTEWHNIVMWRGLAEVAGKYLKKGSKVNIIGKLKTRSWEKDGVTRYTTEIVADEMTMLDSKGNSNQPPGSSSGDMPMNEDQREYQNQQNSQNQSQNQAPDGNSEIDDLPF